MLSYTVSKLVHFFEIECTDLRTVTSVLVSLSQTHVDNDLSGGVVDGKDLTGHRLLCRRGELIANHAVLSLVWIESFHGDDDRTRRGVLRHQHIVQSLAESRPVVIDVHDVHRYRGDTLYIRH